MFLKVKYKLQNIYSYFFKWPVFEMEKKDTIKDWLKSQKDQEKENLKIEESQITTNNQSKPSAKTIFQRNFFQKTSQPEIFHFFAYRRHKAIYNAVFCLVIVVSLVIAIVINFGKTKANNLALTGDDIKAGSYEYGQIDIGSGNSLSLQKGDLGTWTNANAPISPPDITSWPELQYGPSNTLYLLCGAASGCFKRYWVEEKRWEDLAQMPFADYSRMVFDNNHYFYVIGASGRNFYRYDIYTNTWDKLPDTPEELYSGSSLEYVGIDNGYLYAFRGGGLGFFWRFSVGNNSWEALPATVYSVYNGSTMMWDRGDYIYITRGNRANRLLRYKISTGGWEDKGSFSIINDWNRSRFYFLNANEFLYFGERSSGKMLFKYTVANNSFTQITTPFHSDEQLMAMAFDGANKFYFMTSWGQLRMYDYNANQWDEGQSDLILYRSYSYSHAYAYDGEDYLYIISDRFLTKKNLLTGESVTLLPMPSSFAFDLLSYATFYNNKIYVASPGRSNFYSYDLETNTWSEALASMPTNIGYGADFIPDDDYLYVNRGASTATFWRYKISTNNWEILNDVPFSVDQAGGIVKLGTKIYAFSGVYSSGRMACYDLISGIWTEENIAPFTLGSPPRVDRIISNNIDTIYLLPGINMSSTEFSQRFYSYNVETKIWKRLVDFPERVRGNVYYSNPYLIYRSGDLYFLRGDYDSRIWRWTPTSTNYVSFGVWYSKHYDLTQTSQISSLTFNQIGSGNYQVFTRTSDNGAAWDSWLPLSGNAVQSLPRRYFQFKVELSSDGTSTLTLSDFSLNYTQETNPPSLPTSFQAYSEKDGSQLISGNTYPYHHPYFTWSGASDGVSGSGIDGYYVYFGTDSNADPAVSGSYQTTNYYLADTPFTAGEIYYLKIKVKDKLGNLSSASIFFSYRYWFVSPPSSKTIDTFAEFGEGVATNLDISNENGQATLIHRPNGSWSDGDLSQFPQRFRGGGAAYAKGNIYVAMGNNTKYFYRYNIEANIWLRVTDIPVNLATSGSAMRFDGVDSIYLVAGNGTTLFYKYSIGRNEWTELNGLPTPASNTSSISPMGDGKFLLSVAYSAFSYIYNSSTDTFEENAPAAYNFVSASNLYYDGQDAIYALFENNYMQKFVISENRWYTVMRLPAYFSDSQNIGFEGIGDNLYFFANRNARNYLAGKYSISAGAFKQISSPSLDGSSGNYLVTDGVRYLYILQSTDAGERQDNIMIKYDTLTDKYTPELYYPGKSYIFDRSGESYGIESLRYFYTAGWSSIAFDGVDTLYYKNQDIIIAYSIAKKTQLTAWRSPYSGYGHIAYLDGYLYLTAAGGSNRFFRQNLLTYESEELANAPEKINNSNSQNLLVDKEGRLYVARSNNTPQIYRYTPATNSWETLTAPFNLNSNGATITYDGNDKIYFSQGSSANFRYYSIAENTWSGALAPIINDQPRAGAASVYHEGKIYLLKGNNLNTMSVYDTARDVWTIGPNAPTSVNANAGFVKVNNDFALMAPAGSKSAVWRFNFPNETKGNNSNGTYISKNLLLEGVFSYVGIEADVEIPTNTSINIETRSTKDGNIFSDWQDVTEIKLSSNKLIAHVNSPLEKNIQLKLTLISYNGFDNPIVNSVKFHYYSDTTPPNNPSVVHLFSDSGKEKELLSNTWYNYPNPLIDWPDPGEAGGATDGLIGSNISGYYIYVGQDETAIPKTQGVFVTNSEYNPNLSSSDLYYIRIQSVDGSKNVATEVFSNFLYKLDIDKPLNPLEVTADPSGYSNKNLYTFNWSKSEDADSGIEEYCYKTAATDGVYATEQCQKETTLGPIPAAYKQGANILYVRAKDLAGNFSNDTSEVTFYFNSGPPSKPMNLQADPSSGLQNQFKFTWDPPAAFVGNVDKLSYFYSVNELPAAANTTRVEERSVGPAAFATQPGANSFYLVAKDESGNIDWNAYASVNFYANTTAPGVPLNVTIADISSRTSNRWALALSWDPPTSPGSGISHYFIERSDDKLHFSRIGSTQSIAYVDTNVIENHRYYYRIKASDDINNCGPASSIVEMAPSGKYTEPPIVSSGPEIELGVNRVIIKWTTNRPCLGYVTYGTAFDKLIENKGSNDLVLSHKITLEGLTPNTVYYYKLQNFDQDRAYNLDNSFSILRTFKTKQAATIQNVKVSEITLNSAVITWLAPSTSHYQIFYGKSIAYGLSISGNPNSDLVSIKLENLDHTSNYHFKIIATTVDGDQISSDDYNFDTVAYPKVFNIRFQPVEDASNSVEVLWKTNVKTTSIVSYQLQATIGEVSRDEYVYDHSILLTGLADNAEYRILIKGVDQFNNTVISEPVIWKTAVDTKEPTISNVQVEPVYSSSGDKAQLIVSWQTDEPTTSQVEYGIFTKEKKYEMKTNQDNNLTTNHIVIINDLKTSTNYHFRPISLDKSGNIAFAEDTIVTIGEKQISLVQALYNIFKSLFGWLNLNK